MSRSALLVLAAVLLAVAPARAQAPVVPGALTPTLQVTSGVVPDTVTVGDRFRSIVRIAVPAGSRVEFPALPVGDTLQPTDPVAVIDSAGTSTAVYPLVAWVAGVELEARLPVRVLAPDGEVRTLSISLPLPVVRSVLPESLEGVVPRDAKGVVSLPAPSVAWWLWALLLLALFVAAGLAWRLRRSAAVPPPLPATSPRERALADLDELTGGGWADPARSRPLYEEVSRILRRYLAELSPAWGADLTTRELRGRLASAPMSPGQAERLLALLSEADQVKFARHGTDPPGTQRYWRESRDWVERTPAETLPSEEAA